MRESGISLKESGGFPIVLTLTRARQAPGTVIALSYYNPKEGTI
jgi:hypothetical protein